MSKFTTKEECCENCANWIQHYALIELWGYVETKCGHCVIDLDNGRKSHREPEELCENFIKSKSEDIGNGQPGVI